MQPSKTKNNIRLFFGSHAGQEQDRMRVVFTGSGTGQDFTHARTHLYKLIISFVTAHLLRCKHDNWNLSCIW